MPLMGTFWLECSKCGKESEAFTREDALLINVTDAGWEVPYVDTLDQLRKAYTLCGGCRERKQ
jgi:hypothetical protein